MSVTLAEQIAALERAIAARREGRAVQSASEGGRSVSYAQLSLAEMEAALERLLAQSRGGGLSGRRGRIKPFFG